jgi:hypothetical protein
MLYPIELRVQLSNRFERQKFGSDGASSGSELSRRGAPFSGLPQGFIMTLLTRWHKGEVPIQETLHFGVQEGRD